MGAMRKMAVYLGLVEDEAGAYDDEVDPYEAAAVRGTDRSSAGARRDVEPHYSAVREVRPVPAAPRPPRPEPAPRTERVERVDLRDDALGDHDPAQESYRITTLHPRSYNDARRIGEEFRLGTPVIMNLTEMDDEDAKRIIDFSAGLIFGLHGSIERVTNKVFLLSPANVDVAAEARRLAQDGFFNQS